MFNTVSDFLDIQMRKITGLISQYSLEHNEKLNEAHTMFRVNNGKWNAVRITTKGLARETINSSKRFKSYMECFTQAAVDGDADTSYLCLDRGVTRFLGEIYRYLHTQDNN